MNNNLLIGANVCINFPRLWDNLSAEGRLTKQEQLAKMDPVFNCQGTVVAYNFNPRYSTGRELVVMITTIAPNSGNVIGALKELHVGDVTVLSLANTPPGSLP